MLSQVLTSSIKGIDGRAVCVEADLSRGLPTMNVVGLPDTEVKEARDRVIAAIRNSGFDFPACRVTVNLSPAEIKKTGTHFDLPIALSILAASGQLSKDAVERLDKFMLVGELGLDGSIRSCAGVLAMLGALGSHTAVVPLPNKPEAALAKAAHITPLNLKQFADFLEGALELKDPEGFSSLEQEEVFEGDFNEVKGQAVAKRALEIAAAGGHNVLLIGVPGTGKSMLAKRFGAILPPLSHAEALEITKIYSISNMLPKSKLINKRPLREPHHTISDVALIGGGASPRPGEVSLSHHGVLFLDEFAEFSRASLEVLREPMETGVVTISRARERLSFPARFILIAAMNPCPCGYHGSSQKECRCTPVMINRYRGKISGPLLDRIDLTVNLNPVSYKDWGKEKEGESSAEIKKRVMSARQAQRARFAKTPVLTNAAMTPAQIKKFCKMPPGGDAVLEAAMRKMGLSARSLDKILKTARTIADLEGSPDIQRQHIVEVLQYRPLDRKGVADI